MKSIICLLIILISAPVFAQSGYYPEYQVDPNNKKDKQLEYTLPDRDSINRTTPEVSMYYLKSGFSVGTVNGENSQFNLGALGTRRYADEFYYGAEISTHFGAEQMQTTMMNINFGHHFLTWRHRIKPYIGGSFGYAKLADSSSLNRPGGSGVSMGLDLGFQVWKLGPFSINSGLNIYHIVYGNKETTSSDFHDMYLMFGFGF